MHPSRVPSLRRAIVVGRPTPFVEDDVGQDSAASSSNRSQSALSVTCVSTVQPLLERVKVREAARARELSNIV